MNILRLIKYWGIRGTGFRKSGMIRLLIQCLTVSVVLNSCKSDPYGINWIDEDSLTISQYIERNKEEYSKFYRILDKGKLLTTLYAYNPYGEGYTLFLPTDEAIDQFIQQNKNYENFEELLKDTSFIQMLTRYHTINRKVHTDEFPDGALIDMTLTGDRLVTGFFTDSDNQLIKVNNSARIVKSNLKLNNGYIHVISKVLQKIEVSGYDWLQQQDDYSILAQAMELSGIRKRMAWNKYTIFAENDSVYHRIGINNINDLINRVATPGLPYSDLKNSFYQFSAFHILEREYYLNDLYWGIKNYRTLGSNQLTIDYGVKVRINPGIDTYGIVSSGSGDTTVIDYIRLIWESCNIPATTGPVHSISNVLYFKPIPK